MKLIGSNDVQKNGENVGFLGEVWKIYLWEGLF